MADSIYGASVLKIGCDVVRGKNDFLKVSLKSLAFVSFIDYN